MPIEKGSNSTEIEFIENWSMNGAFLYLAMEDRMLDGPTYYDITVNYEILWEYWDGHVSGRKYKYGREFTKNATIAAVA